MIATVPRIHPETWLWFGLYVVVGALMLFLFA
jgi:hypothetical protein